MIIPAFVTNPWVIGGALAAGGAYLYFKNRSTDDGGDTADSQDDGNGYITNGVMYSTGLGGLLPSASISGATGETSAGAGLDSLIAAMTTKSQNDKDVALAGLGVQKELGLKAFSVQKILGLKKTSADKTVALDDNKTKLAMLNSNNQFALMTNYLQNAESLAKAGLASIGGGVTVKKNGGFSLDLSSLFTNQTKNVVYANRETKDGKIIGTSPGGKPILINAGQGGSTKPKKKAA